MFNINESTDAITFTISSEMRNVDRVIRESVAFLKNCRIRNMEEFKIVIRELLLNAIEHGNLNIGERQVNCALNREQHDLFRITVSDQGEGFDSSGLDFTIPEDPKQIRHRGLSLINRISEELKFNDQGRQVVALVRGLTETDFEVVKSGSGLRIKPSGDITASVADKFRVILHDLVQQGADEFIFDLRHVEDLDSVSLSIFIVLYKTLAAGSDTPRLTMTNVSLDLLNLFHMTNMDKLYTIEASQ